jgi:hypothetical protein
MKRGKHYAVNKKNKSMENVYIEKSESLWLLCFSDFYLVHAFSNGVELEIAL